MKISNKYIYIYITTYVTTATYLHVLVDVRQVFRDLPLLKMAKSNLKMVQLWCQAQVYSSDLFPSNKWTLIQCSNKSIFISLTKDTQGSNSSINFMFVFQVYLYMCLKMLFQCLQFPEQSLFRSIIGILALQEFDKRWEYL